MSASDYTAAVRAQIRAERAAADLSRDELATRDGLTYMTVRRIEGGDKTRPDSPIDTNQLAALCRVFGIPVSRLLAMAEERAASSGGMVEVADDGEEPTLPPSGPRPGRAPRKQPARSRRD